MGSFSFCKFSCSKAILFGGTGSQDNGRSYSDRMYHFDLGSRVSINLFFLLVRSFFIQAWTGPVKHSLPLPIGCRFHTLSTLFDPECDAVSVAPRWMVLLWGKVSTGTIGKDVWALNVETWTWKKLQVMKSSVLKIKSHFLFLALIQLCESFKPRAWHIACSHYARRDIAVFGGNVVDEDYYEGRDAVADLQFIPFGKSESHAPHLAYYVHVCLHIFPLL